MSLVKRLRRHSSNKRFYGRFSRFPSDDLNSKIIAHCLETSGCCFGERIMNMKFKRFTANYILSYLKCHQNMCNLIEVRC